MKHEGNKLKTFGKMFQIPRKGKSTSKEMIDYFVQNKPSNRSPSPHSSSHVTFRSLSDTLVPEVNKLVFKRKCGFYSGSLGEPLLPLSRLEPKLINETRKSHFNVLTIALCSTGFLLGLLVAVFFLELRSRAEIVWIDCPS